MKYNQFMNDKIYTQIKKEIDSFLNHKIPLERLFSAAENINDDMPVFLQSPEGQALFKKIVMRLVEEKILSPVGKANTAQGLNLKYRIKQSEEEKDQELVAHIIRTIQPPAKLDYYLKNPQDYVDDQAIIGIIFSCLRQQNRGRMTVNERAYQLFGDEKFFKGDDKKRSIGEMVLKRLGLNYESIGCLETVEPFFSFHNKEFHALSTRNIYIIENKDTFWSFKRNILDAPSNIQADMLIYGEGKKIISSFRFVEEYEVDARYDKFFYFGDVDPEGINIYCQLVDEYQQYHIRPFAEGYQAVCEIGMSRAPVKTPKAQRFSKENVNRFIQHLEESSVAKELRTEDARIWTVMLREHLEGGFYIPQEALSAVLIKERFGESIYDGSPKE